MIVLFGFLFVTVSSRLTGEIGSSSNPISGMTVATLLLTCLIFVLLGWVGTEYRLAALSIAGIVCIAASNGGTTSQDLKTGYLVGATPRSQQIAILVGALTSASSSGSPCCSSTRPAPSSPSKPEIPADGRGPDVAELTQTETPDGKDYKVWWVVKPIAGAAAGQVPGRRPGKAAYLIDPAINGRVDDPRRRHEGRQVRRPQGPADGPDHRRDHDAESCPGCWSSWASLIAVVMQLSRVPLAGLRGGRLPAAVDVDADLRRRPGPGGGRPGPAGRAPRSRTRARPSCSPAATSPAARSRGS